LGLSREDHRRAALVIEEAERAETLGGILVTTLAALEEHLAITGAFILTLDEQHIAYAGVQHGWPEYVIEEYFERWRHVDPLASGPARADFTELGWTNVERIYASLDPSRRRFCDDFMRRVRIAAELSVRIPAGGTDGYLTLQDQDTLGPREYEIAAMLAPELARLLRARLPRRIPGVLTAREAHVVELVSLGFANAEIATVLGVEADTVKKHVSSAMAKLGTNRRTQLAVAWATGVRPDPLIPPLGNGARGREERHLTT
jgi:DNA-binding CsgD family transcriptional regulator